MRRWLAVLLVAIPALAGATMSMTCANQPLLMCAAEPELAALAGLTSAPDKFPYFTGSGTAALADLSSTMRTFLNSSSSANLRNVLANENGTGVAIFDGPTSMTLISPLLGTPASGVLTSCTGLPIASGVSGLDTGIATFLGTASSANLLAAMDDETGTGALVFGTSPTLVTPALGTPTSGTLTSCTGLPIASGVSGLGTGVATLLATPSSANLRGALTDENGTGAAIFDSPTSMTLITPALGTPSSGVLTSCTGLPIASGVSGLGTGVATFLATPTTANFAAAVTGETGTGAVVFATSPTNVTFDVEGTGNAITTVSKIWIPAASCQNTTASLNWDTPTTNAPAAACITGTNTQKGVADFNDTTDQSLQTTLMLPADWTGAIDATVKWLAASTSGTTGWCVQLICVADAETDDPAFPAQAAGNCVSDTAKGTTLQTNDAALASITATGCAAGELMHVRLSRDGDGGAVTDSMTGNARLIGIELTLRRAQ